MKIFKLIEIDLDKERKRIDKVFKGSKRQREALHKLVNLFEQGRWQECLNHVNDKEAFPYNAKGEYPETEHIGLEISRVLQDLWCENFYTQAELLKQAKEKLDAERKS